MSTFKIAGCQTMIKGHKIGLFLIGILLVINLFNLSIILISSQNQEEIPENYLREGGRSADSDPNTFISIWDTTLASVVSTARNQIMLPLESDGTYNFTVGWGDGSNDTITSWDQAEVTHTYSLEGIFTINISGTINGWQFYSGGDRLKIVEIQQWGALRLGNAGGYFYGCRNLNITTTDVLDLTGTTNLNEIFSDCLNLGTSGNLNTWDVSSVTSMYRMFYEATMFNQPLDDWNVSSVTNLAGTFAGASSFNHSLNSWNVSGVISMYSMFYKAAMFNQPLDAWNVSRVTDMGYMFRKATMFNQPLDAWNVSSATSMYCMFCEATMFNQPLDAWNVSSVTDMGYMFYKATRFNQPLGAWNVSHVMQMKVMFADASSFNQPLGAWNVSRVTNMMYMFYYASSFDQPLGTWNVSSVRDMNWMFFDVTLSTSNYDGILWSWAQLPLQNGVVFHAGKSKFSHGIAETARQIIIDVFGWSITDYGHAHVTPNMLVLNAIEGRSYSGKIVLSWNPIEGATNYDIYRSSFPIIDVSGLTSIVTGLTDTTYQDIILENGTYYYVVVASNEEKDFPISNCEDVIVTIVHAPSAPILNAIISSFTSGKIILSWNPVEGASYYRIFRSTSPITDVDKLTAIITKLTGTTYQDTVVKRGRYYYVVVATNVGGISPISNCASTVVALVLPIFSPVWFGIIILGGLIGFVGIQALRRR